MSFFPDHYACKICFHDGIPQTFVFFRFVDIIVITVHNRFWNVGQANCFLPGKYMEVLSISLKMADYFIFPLLF